MTFEGNAAPQDVVIAEGIQINSLSVEGTHSCSFFIHLAYADTLICPFRYGGMSIYGLFIHKFLADVENALHACYINLLFIQEERGVSSLNVDTVML